MRKTDKKIRKEEAGISLLEFLCRKFTYFSKEDWRNCLEENRVAVNGKPANADHILFAGDRLETTLPKISEPPVRKDFTILYEDSALIAVDKPGNLPCHPGGRYFENTLWRLLSQKLQCKALRFVHRIDRETSGIVLAAKSREISATLQSDFHAGRIEKRYLALVSGLFPLETLKASGYLAGDSESQIRKKRRFISSNKNKTILQSDKWCETFLRGLARGAGASLVEARPKTGRLHQIRATLLALGFPVIGDKLYGLDETIFLRFISDRMTEKDLSALQLPRQALHATEIRFRHPVSNMPVTIKAAFPEEWEAFRTEHFSRIFFVEKRGVSMAEAPLFGDVP